MIQQADTATILPFFSRNCRFRLVYNQVGVRLTPNGRSIGGKPPALVHIVLAQPVARRRRCN